MTKRRLSGTSGFEIGGKLVSESTTASMNEAFQLLGVTNFKDLSLAYTREDQKLMKSGKWDAHNPALITNRVKTLLEQIDPSNLRKSENEWRSEILWFWYHHAISYAIWKAKDRLLAQVYAIRALGFQAVSQPREKGHRNRLTELFWHLVYDRVSEAKQWMAEMPPGADPVEHANGLELIKEYERGEFF